MVQQENNGGWSAAAYIWWGQIWRVLSIDFFIYLGSKAVLALTPIIYKALADFIYKYEGDFLLLFAVFHLYIYMWAIRESFTDSYTTFFLIAENKESRRNMFGFDKRLNWDIVMSVWWAQLWRILLIPAATIGGSIAAAHARNPGAANYSYMLNSPLAKFSLGAIFILSFWATKESLGNRYTTFRFVTKPRKGFYDGT